MRNATPLVLTLFLAATALFLAFRDTPPPAPKNEGSSSELETGGKHSEAAKRSEPVPAVVGEGTSEAAPWPMQMSDIPADPQAVFGNLSNGFRYMILPNAEPPKRFSMRLHIRAGSLMEAENQRGLAHFLEHMVFNGTKNYKDATS